jgi:hypothetical protein
VPDAEPEPAAAADAEADDKAPDPAALDEAKPEEAARELDSLGDAELDGNLEEQRQQAKPEADDDAAVEVPPGWDLIDRADAARKAGDCRSARADYSVATEDDNPAVRARAFAGLGFCDDAAGNSDQAEANFAKARAEDGAVAPLIDRETNKPYRSATKKPTRAKRKPKSRAKSDKNDPFSGL